MPMIRPRRLLVLALIAPILLAAQLIKPPAAERRPVTDIYSAATVTDEYRWLENPSDPAVIKWVDEQNRYSRSVLDAVPNRAAIEQRVRQLITARPAAYSDLVLRGGRLFALKFQPPKEQALLITLDSINDPKSEKVLLDPMTISPDSKSSIDFFVPSLDGRFVAVSLSRGGRGNGTGHIYRVAGGRETGEVIPRVNGGTAGGSVAWNADNCGFYYTRYPSEGERAPADLSFYQQVYFHKMGTPLTEDRYEIGKDFPRIAETS